MQIQTLTYEQLIGTVAVILLIIGIYNTIMTAIKTHREEKRRKDAPVSDLEAIVKEHEEKLKRDYERLNTLEESTRIMMRSQMAQLHHSIDGNSIESLQKSYKEIQDFLIER